MIKNSTSDWEITTTILKFIIKFLYQLLRNFKQP